MAKEAYEKTAEGWQQLSCYPSITTIRTRIKAMSATQKCIGRDGIRKATNLMGAGATDIRAVMFGERVESDEVLLSLMTNANGGVTVKAIPKKNAKDEPEKDEIFRCWLSVMLDVATRMPLAWVMSETPNADHTLAMLRMAMRDKSREASKYGCTQMPAPAVRIMTAPADNGTAFRNGTVRAAQLGIGSTVIDTRTYHATDKPYVERLIGRLQWDVLNYLPGYVGSRPGELPGYDPKKAAALTPDMVYGIITRYLVDEYPLQPHLGTGMFGATPMQKLEQVLRDYPTLTPPSPSERRLHLGLKKQLITVNDHRTLSAPLLSRCPPIHVPYPTREHLVRFAGREGRRRDLADTSIEAIGKALTWAMKQGYQPDLRVVLRMLDLAEDLENRPMLH
ncbi:transposase family protein [Paracoccus sp. (in: a-proteobacteria)]|uniref:transposase family protein n=1 Tax=Paracoccus sp. TaxID=267 RepID=UPI0028B1798B|nr:transposase family protein [Paracoccus sp. (in: a-proteobacteria)]